MKIQHTLKSLIIIGTLFIFFCITGCKKDKTTNTSTNYKTIDSVTISTQAASITPFNYTFANIFFAAQPDGKRLYFLPTGNESNNVYYLDVVAGQFISKSVTQINSPQKEPCRCGVTGDLLVSNAHTLYYFGNTGISFNDNGSNTAWTSIPVNTYRNSYRASELVLDDTTTCYYSGRTGNNAGNISMDFFVYNSLRKKWLLRSGIAYGASECGLVHVNNNLYVMGGSMPTGGTDDISNKMFKNTMDAYSDTWITLDTMPFRFTKYQDNSAVKCVALNNTYIVVLSQVESTQAGIRIFDTRTNKWKKELMPVQIPADAVLNSSIVQAAADKIYLVYLHNQQVVVNEITFKNLPG